MIAVPAAIAVIVVLWLVFRRGTAPLGPAPAATLAALAVPDTPSTRELLGRWRDRARRWRTVATFPAVVVAIAGSLQLRGQLDIGLVEGVGVTPLWTDPLLVGLLALTLGGLAAELHHLRRRPAGPRTADLRPRDVALLRRPRSVVRRTVLALLIGTSAVAHVLVVLPGRAAGSFSALVLSAAVLGLAEVTERRIAVRPRGVLPADLVAADDAVRGAAVRSVDDTASAATLLLVGWASLGIAGTAPAGGLYDLLAIAASLSVLGLSLWWAWRSAPGRLLPGADRDEVAVTTLRP